ncbi:hypothetical protein MSG28_009291 [Choristoneura fumiferana]|uniref:Uncharacterized protein n=1 Tax=Choristoneura fumiferana TaxID=7141 RepID=A0ACC0KWZ1_CHOFU|nr:hypothetical protein MSG28_009291 [Choristoneura fumiferana]
MSSRLLLWGAVPRMLAALPLWIARLMRCARYSSSTFPQKLNIRAIWRLKRPFRLLWRFTNVLANNVPIERRLTYVEVVVTGSIRPTVIFSWKRTTVEIQYNWWQLSEVIIYHIRALGQYKPLPTTTTEEPTTTTELTTTTTTKTTTRRWG